MGRAIRAVRLRQNITQTDAAERASVSRTSWVSWEDGRPMVLRSDVQDRIAQVLGVDREELLLEQVRQREHASRNPRATGAGEREADWRGPDRETAVFPLKAGRVVIEFPAGMDADSWEELEEYLQLFLKRRRAS